MRQGPKHGNENFFEKRDAEFSEFKRNMERAVDAALSGRFSEAARRELAETIVETERCFGAPYPATFVEELQKLAQETES